MAKAKLCSIDSSSKKTGMAFFKGLDLHDHKLLDYSSITDKEERIKKMCLNIISELDNYQPDMVLIEDSWNARNIETTKLLTRIMGVVYGWCITNNREYMAILPSQWRKHAGISQGSKKRAELKQASIDFVFHEYGITCGDDEADSIAIGKSYLNYLNSIELFE